MCGFLVWNSMKGRRIITNILLKVKKSVKWEIWCKEVDFCCLDINVCFFQEGVYYKSGCEISAFRYSGIGTMKDCFFLWS